jgi:hypothetical protein
MTAGLTTPRTYSVRELAKLEALEPLAAEIAAAVFDHVEGSRCIVKDQLAAKIHSTLLLAKSLWADPPAPEPKGDTRALTTRGQPAASRIALSEDECAILRDALRSMASRDARTADGAPGSQLRAMWVRRFRDRAATATRLADLIADGAEVAIQRRHDCSDD